MGIRLASPEELINQQRAAEKEERRKNEKEVSQKDIANVSQKLQEATPEEELSTETPVGVNETQQDQVEQPKTAPYRKHRRR